MKKCQIISIFFPKSLSKIYFILEFIKILHNRIVRDGFGFHF